MRALGFNVLIRRAGHDVGMAVDPLALSGLDQLERELVARQCHVLGLQQPSAVEGVRLGQSGSLVVRLVSLERPVILKITTADDRLDRARLERRLIANSDLAVVMPHYVAGDDSPDVVSLATEAHDSLSHANAITDNEWRSIATSLGLLHRLPVPEWIDLPGSGPPQPAAIAASTRAWADWVPADLAATAQDIIWSDLASCGPGGAGEVLEHGDCHTENIVRDRDGRFRWIDWQEARVGDGFSDLVFLWQRAEFAGARPPREGMRQAYVTARGLTLDRAVRRSLDLAELRLLFLAWPPFLDYGPPRSQRHMTDRLRDLTATLRRDAEMRRPEPGAP